jgi:hypothetical protein
MNPAWSFKKQPKKKKATGERKSIYEKTKQELISVLDREFSRYVRLSNAYPDGTVSCVTCGKSFF